MGTRLARITMALAALAAVQLTAAAAAQTPDGTAAVITGRVTTLNRLPVWDAEVSIPALGLRTRSDEDGSYVLLVPLARAGAKLRLEVRHAGFLGRDARLRVSDRGARLDVSLDPDLVKICEVQLERSLLERTRDSTSPPFVVDTGAVRKSDEWNILAALAAKASGLETSVSSGEPGAAAFLRIRGTTTLTGSGQPLIVVDGVPFDNQAIPTSTLPGRVGSVNRASDLNPDDIASVEVLKGPAAARYGARGAQGVIVITTKGEATRRDHACSGTYRRLMSRGKRVA